MARRAKIIVLSRSQNKKLISMSIENLGTNQSFIAHVLSCTANLTL